MILPSNLSACIWCFVVAFDKVKRTLQKYFKFDQKLPPLTLFVSSPRNKLLRCFNQIQQQLRELMEYRGKLHEALSTWIR